MSDQDSSLCSRTRCEVRSAMRTRSDAHRGVHTSLFEAEWLQLGERLRHGTSHLAPRTSHVSAANSEITHA